MPMFRSKAALFVVLLAAGSLFPVARGGDAGAASSVSMSRSSDSQMASSLAGSFALRVGGFRAGRIDIDAEAVDGGYRLSMIARADGIIRRFYDGSLKAAAQGLMSDQEPLPASFEMTTREDNETREVVVRYDRGTPVVSASPAFKPKPYELDPATQGDALDPVSALIAAFGARPAAELCDRRINVFDARRRFAVRIDSARAVTEGGTIQCEASLKRAAGFKAKLLAKPPFHFKVEFREGPDGLWWLDRLIAETPVGDAVLSRRR